MLAGISPLAVVSFERLGHLFLACGFDFAADSPNAAHESSDDFIRRNAVFTSIDYPGLPHTYATGINNWGQVVGCGFDLDSDGSVTVLKVFLWYKGKFTDLCPPGWWLTSLAPLTHRISAPGDQAL